MNEHRMTDRLIGYWNQVRKEAPLPEYAHFNVSAIDDIWQQCLVLIVLPTQEGKPPQLNFQMVGDKVRVLYAQDMIGRTFSPPVKQFQGAAIFRKVTDVLSNPVPINDMGQFINAASKMIKFRACLLPFGTQGRITHVVVGLSWREF